MLDTAQWGFRMSRLIDYDIDLAYRPEDEDKGIVAHVVPRVVITDKIVSRSITSVLAYLDHDVIVGPQEDDPKEYCLKIYTGNRGYINSWPFLADYDVRHLKMLAAASEGRLPINPLIRVQQVMRSLLDENLLERKELVCSLEMRMKHMFAAPPQKPL